MKCGRRGVGELPKARGRTTFGLPKGKLQPTAIYPGRGRTEPIREPGYIIKQLTAS